MSFSIGKRPFPTKRAALRALPTSLKNSSKNKLSVILMVGQAASSLVNGFMLFFLGAVAFGMEKTGLDSFVSDSYLYKTLDSKNLRSSFDNGEIRCAGCGTVITRNNLGMIIEKDSPDFICENPSCSLKYHQKLN